MIIPETEPLKSDFLGWVLDVCLMSKAERKALYDRRRTFFLYGTGSDQDIIYNRIESHLDLVGSFLYSPDHAEFSLSAPANSSDAECPADPAGAHGRGIPSGGDRIGGILRAKSEETGKEGCRHRKQCHVPRDADASNEGSAQNVGESENDIGIDRSQSGAIASPPAIPPKCRRAAMTMARC